MIDFLHGLLDHFDTINVFQNEILEHSIDKGWKIFNIPFVDKHDFLKLIFKFGFFFVFLTILVRYIYYPKTRKKVISLPISLLVLPYF